MRVLVVESEKGAEESLAAVLRNRAKYAVDTIEDGAGGFELTKRNCYDLIIIASSLSGPQQQNLLRMIRGRLDRTPILIVAAQSDLGATIALLDEGADDFMIKPLEKAELVARARALIRRAKGLPWPILNVGNIDVDAVDQTVHRAGKRIVLSPTEYRILEYLIHKPGAVVSRKELLEHLYDYNWARHSNVIEVHICKLRRKLTADDNQPCIENVRGRGYRLLVA